MIISQGKRHYICAIKAYTKFNQSKAMRSVMRDVSTTNIYNANGVNDAYAVLTFEDIYLEVKYTHIESPSCEILWRFGA